jgi:hypothetical protein
MWAMSVALDDHGESVPGRGATMRTSPSTLAGIRLGP